MSKGVKNKNNGTKNTSDGSNKSSDKEEEHKEYKEHKEQVSNRGTLKLDASVADQEIKYPDFFVPVLDWINFRLKRIEKRFQKYFFKASPHFLLNLTW